MALLWFDGFPGGSSTQIAQNYDSGMSANAGTSGSRTGAGHIGPNGIGQGLKKTLTISGSVIVGIAIQHGLIATTSAREFLRIYEGSTNHLSLFLLGSDNNYVLEVRRGDGVVLATGTTRIPPDWSTAGWRYIELKAFIHDTLGSFEVRIEGVTEMLASGIDTRNNVTGTTGVPTAVQLMCSVSSTGFGMDDFYVADTSGSGVTDFLGPGVRIDSLPATAAGDFAQWTPFSSTNISNVDEGMPHDSDTTYVSAASTGLKDSHQCADITFTPARIVAVVPQVYVKKDDVGTVQLQVRVRSGGVSSADTSKAVSTSYAPCRGNMVTVDPATGTAWTATGINAAQVEYERTA